MWFLSGLMMLLQVVTYTSGQTLNICGDDTLPTKTFEIKPNKTGSVSVISTDPKETSRWIITATKGINLSVSLNVKDTRLYGIPCNPESPSNRDSSLNFVVKNNYVVKVCPFEKLQDKYSYVSNDRIEIVHCRPTRQSQFLATISTIIAGILPASSEIKTLAVKRDSRPQWMALQLENESQYGQYGLVAQLTGIRVRAGRSGGCKAGYIKFTDVNGEVVHEKVCNKRDGATPKLARVVTKQGTLNVTFKNAIFKLNYFSSPLSEIEKFLTTKQTASTNSIPGSSTPSGGVQNQRFPIEPRSPTDNGNTTKATESSKIYEAIGLGCAGILVILVFAVVCIVVQRRRQRVRKEREDQSIKNIKTENTEYMDRRELGSDDGVRSINNQMYEKILKNGSGKKEFNVSSAENVGTYGETSQDRLLGRRETSIKPDYTSEEEKRQLRMSQLGDVYLGYDQAPNFQPPPPPPPLPMSLPPPQEAWFTEGDQTERPPLPTPPTPGTPHFYATINDGSDEAFGASYAMVNKTKKTEKSRSQESLDEEEKIPEAPDYVTNRYDVPPMQEENIHIHSNLPPVVSEHRESNAAPAISFTPSESFKRQGSSRKASRVQMPLDTDGYLSLTTSDNLPPPPPALEEPRTPNRSYVDANSVSQEDVRKHFAKRKKVPRPFIDNANAASMPDLMDKRKQTKLPETARLPLMGKDRLKPPQMSFSGHNLSTTNRYKQPRPSAPDIFIRAAYTSGEDLTSIRKHLEAVAAKGMAERSGGGSSELASTKGSTESELYYDSPRPSIDGSQGSLLDARRPAVMYDAPRPSLPNIFSEDLKQFVATSESRH